MIVPGLCSVTLRAAAIEEVAAIARGAGLGAIEWGGDVHVPPGDRAAAARARAVSEGLVVTYGSYLLAGGVPDDHAALAAEVARTLDTARELGAATVRVWCPFGVLADDGRRGAVVDALGVVATAAAERDLTVGIEHHGGTLTETAASTAAVLAVVGAPNLTSYWQPPYWIGGRTVADDLADVAALGASISHLHVYEWTAAPAVTRLPLVAGERRWRAVLRAVDAIETPASLHGPRLALLEFVVDDDPARLAADAATLQGCVGRP